jgi:thiol-disulfide isomerase/thioredoxin
MKAVSILLIIVILLSGLETKPQTQILQQAIQHISQYHNLSYTQVLKQKNPFSDDITILTIKSNVSNTYSQGTNTELYYMKELRGFKYVFNGSVRMDLDLKNKTYEIKTNPQDEPYFSPYYWLKFIQSKLEISPEKIKTLPDTIINNTTCYHIRMPLTDSGTSRVIYDLCLNQSNYLPVYTRQFLQGIFGKGDIKSDVIITVIDENTYSDYNVNSKNFPDIAAIKIPSDFNPEKKVALILPGKKAPNWQLQDLQNNTYSNTKLQGKVTLIDFSSISCAACMLSLPTLERFHKKYKAGDVEIVSINISDNKESIERFVRKNNIEYPVLVNGENTGKKFQVSSYPTFYLIDKQGNVVTSYDGYSDDLEKKLITDITAATTR